MQLYSILGINSGQNFMISLIMFIFIIFKLEMKTGNSIDRFNLQTESS